MSIIVLKMETRAGFQKILDYVHVSILGSVEDWVLHRTPTGAPPLRGTVLPVEWTISRGISHFDKLSHRRDRSLLRCIENAMAAVMVKIVPVQGVL
jgi:hypothetical protein